MAFAGFAACGKQAIVTGPKPELFGTYEFEARVETPSRNGGGTDVQGIMHVLTDTVIVEGAGCRSENMMNRPGSRFVYHCVDYDLSFDRENPLKQARVSVRATVADRQTSCETYGKDASGQQVCLKTTTDPIERAITISEYLKFKKLGIGAEREP